MPSQNGFTIPAAVAKAYDDYGFDKKIETAVSFRMLSDWCAILFKDRGEFYAVDFVQSIDGEWEVSNDYVGPFDSVHDFQTANLTVGLF